MLKVTQQVNTPHHAGPRIHIVTILKHCLRQFLYKATVAFSGKDWFKAVQLPDGHAGHHSGLPVGQPFRPRQRPALATPMLEARAGPRVGRPPRSGASCQSATPACGPHWVFSLAHHSASFPPSYSSLLGGISEHLRLVTGHLGRLLRLHRAFFVWGLRRGQGYF